ncbi:crossover junction endodeoxyribonuclease RuvC [Patescibacteria group bacterium]|nr:crossover junction endodeoxyribonuclease RuvC [Patescibacteria group bacterium]
MIILGIDPGLATIGYGLIKKNKKKIKGKMILECLGCGLIKTTPALERPERLEKINNELSKLIKKYKPNILVMENVYFFKNAKTVISVSQAQGVILLTAAKNKIPVFYFTPLQIKMTVTGFGRAEKKVVQERIKKVLNLKELPKPIDASDALATALTYLIKES